MKDILDAIAEHVPATVVVGIAAVTALFWGIHYWRGFRDYGDTFRDKTFLSLTIVAVAGLCLYWVNRAPAIPTASGRPILLVPYFDGDERDQYRTAFTTQLEQTFSKTGDGRGVYLLPVLLADPESAIQSAKRYGAKAAMYGAKIIRDNDTVKLCFKIALIDSNSTKPYAMLPVEVPLTVLNEIATTLAGGVAAESTPASSALNSRLDALEQQLSEMRNALGRANADLAPAATFSYGRKYAVIAGVNEIPNTGFALQYAVSDAEAMNAALTTLGFQTTLLTGHKATKATVLKALADLESKATDQDLVVFYYAGNSSADAEGKGGARLLKLYLSDAQVGNAASTWSINDLRTTLERIDARHRLAIIDGCHGTAGLSGALASSLSSTEPGDTLLQFFAASGDEEYAGESADIGGGTFTQSLVRVLREGTTGASPLWMHDVLAKTVELVRTGSKGSQTPKLVTVAGRGEVLWARNGGPSGR